METNVNVPSSGDKGVGLQVQACIAEFAALRSEILDRSRLQHTLVIASLGAFATLSGTALTIKNPLIALLIPFLTSPLALLYVDHHMMIQRLGEYIDQRIGSRLAMVIGDRKVLGWEQWLHEALGHVPTVPVGRRGEEFWEPLVRLLRRRVSDIRFSTTLAVLLGSVNVFPIIIAFLIQPDAAGTDYRGSWLFRAMLWSDIVLALTSIALTAFEVPRFKRATAGGWRAETQREPPKNSPERV